MCFSASASFTASAMLSLIGIASLKKTKKAYLFASIPLIFAIQQAAEGALWLAFTHKYLFFLQPFATGTFLFFAFILWPIWIPLSIASFNTSKNKVRQAMLFFCFLFGLGIALYFIYVFLAYDTKVFIENHHIVYDIPLTLSQIIPAAAFYALATIVPFFVIRNYYLYALGVLLALSYIVSWIFYTHAFISIWCFFAAILSIVVYTIL